MAPEDVATEVQRRAQVPASSCILDGTGTLTLPALTREMYDLRRDSIVGAYRIVREVGVGGMGVVYEAVDERLKRRAAIKMIRGGVGVSADAVRRFQTEAEAVAQVHHPNIVQIYDVGWHGGQPYVALEYLPGGSLYTKAANKPQPPDEAAAIVRVLADAMQQAHSSGVIHRDLKPANILFAADGTPKISDFGAARLTADDHADGGAALTKTGVVIGTPQYMAPEQARGGGITPAVDVYALGAVLYDLLTGRPPHDGPNAFDVLQSAVANEPVPPRRLAQYIPRDLETICLKALAKHPNQRYSTAGAMAEDLARYLAGDSILAKPDATLVRLWKKARRKPAIAGLAAGLILVAIAGVTGVAWQYTEAIQNAKVANINKEAAEKNAAEARTEETRARAAVVVKEQSLYRSRVSEIALMLQDGDYRRAMGLLLESSRIAPRETDLRHWEWHHLNRLGANHLWSVELSDLKQNVDLCWPHAIAVSSDGKTLAISGGDPYFNHGFDRFAPAQLFIIDAATGRVRKIWHNALPEAADQLVWVDNELLAAATPHHGVRVLHAASGKTIHAWDGPLKGVYATSWLSPDGKYGWKALNDYSLELFDTRTGDRVRTITLPVKMTCFPKTTQDATNWRILVGSSLGTHVFDPDSGEEQLLIPGSPHRAAISRNGHHLAIHLATSDDGAGCLDVWDLTSSRKLWSVPRPRMTEDSRLEFSPDGDKLAEVFNSATHVRLHDVRHGRLDCELRGHTNRVLDFRFSPDGCQIATASNDGSVRLWDLKEQAEMVRHRVHGTGARVVGFDPNGWRLYSGGMDGYAFAWDLTRERTDGTRLPGTAQQGASHGGCFAGGVWFGPDGYARFLDTTFARLFIFDPATYTPLAVVILEDLPSRGEKTSSDYSLSNDARYLVGPSRNGKPGVWDATTGKLLRWFDQFQGRCTASAISSDGSQIAVNMFQVTEERGKPPIFLRQYFVADAKTGEILHHKVLDGFGYTAMVFDVKQPRLYLGVSSIMSKEHGVHVLDLSTKELSRIPMDGPNAVRNLAVSPDGEWLAGIDWKSDGNGPRLFGIRTDNTGKGWMEFALGPATGLAFSPDSRRLAVARYDDSLMILDAHTGREAFLKSVPTTRWAEYAFPARVAFSPDSRSLVMNHSGSQLSVWRTDDWTGTPESRLDDRRVEAGNAAYAYHLRRAQEAAVNPAGTAYRFHAAWLDKLPAPNAFMKSEWEQQKQDLRK